MCYHHHNLQSFYPTTFADLLDKHRFSPSNDVSLLPWLCCTPQRWIHSKQGAYNQPQNDCDMSRATPVRFFQSCCSDSLICYRLSFDVSSLLMIFRMSWGLSTCYVSGANKYHEHQFRPTGECNTLFCLPTTLIFSSRNSAAVAGDDADAKRLLARVQGMLGLAQKDTSRGIVFILFILWSVLIVILTTIELQHRGKYLILFLLYTYSCVLSRT